MSVTIEVASTDRTTAIEPDSLQVSRALTSQIDTCKFEVVRKDSSGWKPALLDDVVVSEGATAIFGGIIIEVEEEIAGGDVEVCRVTCKDYSFDLDRRLVADTYENVTVQSIIEDIIDNYTTGFTYTNVVAPVTIGFIAFKYEYPSKCLQQLAEIIGYDWYVDENKDVHFFAKESVLAPFNLTDTNGTYYYDTLKIRSDVKSLRNTIIVRGGKFRGNTITEAVVADGDQITFQQSYQYSNVIVEVDGAPQTVGIDFITDPTTVDCLYNFNEKSIKFPDASKPTAGQLVEVTGEPHIPVIVKQKSPVSVSEFGSFEYKVIDASINSKQGARDRAEAELRSWADELVEGSFETTQSGLSVGQKINVQSTKRSINTDFIISRIQSKLINPQQFKHSVTLVTTKTYGIIEFLQGLLTQKDKEIVISQDEIVDLVESVYEDIVITEAVVTSKVHNTQTESMTVADSPTVQALDYAVEFCAGDFTPTGVKRVFICDGSPLG